MKNLSLPISMDDVLRGKSVEWERLEYKAGWNPEAVLHSICAFANDFHNLGGGYIVIGIAEKNGRPVLPPVGLDPDSLDSIQKVLLNLGHSSIQPMYHPLSTPCEVDGKWILVIWVPGGETRPYKAKVSLAKDATEWAYFIRKQSSTVRAKGADEQELIGLAATVPFDDRYNQQASIDDLSPRLMEEFLRDVGSELADEVKSLSPEALGRQMNIVGGPSEASFPKNAGLLFFNDDPRRFFPATQIDVVWFPDGAGGDRFEEKTFSGPLSRMTREALDYIQRNYLKETVIKHSDRAKADRFWNFPYAAVEEALVNAVYHRSYEIREPVEVRITPQDLVILSFPGPDRSIRMDDLRAGRAVSRRYRNRRIGEFLKELDLTEGRSTGIPKILREMAANGSPAPEFDSDDDRTSYLVRLPVHPRAKTTDQAQSGAQSGAQSPTQSSTQSPTQSENPVIRLLAVLRDGDLSPKDLRLRLGLSHRPTFRENYLNPAMGDALIEPTIPDKPTSRLQKYRLTEKGRKLLENS
jgi:ATP-dependent DNA helicase RecG